MGDFDPNDFDANDFEDGLAWQDILQRIKLQTAWTTAYKDIFQKIKLQIFTTGYEDLSTTIKIKDYWSYEDIRNRIKIRIATFTPVWEIRQYRGVAELSFPDSQVLDIEIKLGVSESIGEFKITAENEPIIDVQEGDIVEIYLGSEEEGINKISSGQVLHAKRGGLIDKTMKISGRDWGKLLQEYKISSKTYSSETASEVIKDIVYDITKQVGIPTPTERLITVNNVVESTKVVTLDITEMTMWDAVKKVCNYTNYDFFIDKDKDLNVIGAGSRNYNLTLTESNIQSDYEYYKDASNILNKIIVVGALATSSYPENEDIWTNYSDPDANGWSGIYYTYSDVTGDTTITSSTDKVKGDYSVRAYTTQTIQRAVITYSIDTSFAPLDVETWSGLHYYMKHDNNFNYKIRLESETTADYFESIGWRYNGAWTFNDELLGSNNESLYNAVGNAQWTNINRISWYFEYPIPKFDKARFDRSRIGKWNVLFEAFIDNLYFTIGQVEAMSYDLSSQSTWGLHWPPNLHDETIHTYTEVKSLANYIIRIYKNPISVVENLESEFGYSDLLQGDKINIDVTEVTDSLIVKELIHRLNDGEYSNRFTLSYLPPSIERKIKALSLQVSRLEERG